MLLDIGSGDGRIVIEAAKEPGLSQQAHGVELNRWLIYYSRWMAYRGGVSSSTKFIQRDLWKYDLSPYNQIVIFGVEEMVSRMKTVYCKISLLILLPDAGTGEEIRERDESRFGHCGMSVSVAHT